jgi:hypothetical protein
VGIEDGLLVVNGATVVEKYIDNENMDGFYFGPDVVPAGHVFLLGDNRDTSEDSRAFGPVAVDEIDGRVLTPVATRLTRESVSLSEFGHRPRVKSVDEPKTLPGWERASASFAVPPTIH